MDPPRVLSNAFLDARARASSANTLSSNVDLVVCRLPATGSAVLAL